VPHLQSVILVGWVRRPNQGMSGGVQWLVFIDLKIATLCQKLRLERAPQSPSLPGGSERLPPFCRPGPWPRLPFLPQPGPLLCKVHACESVKSRSPAVVPVSTKVKPWRRRSIRWKRLVGGLVGMAADASTGAGLDHYPNPVEVDLVPLQPTRTTSPKSTPRAKSIPQG
jgi:hypothetical protein